MKSFIVVIVLAALTSVYCHPLVDIAPETLEGVDANLAVDADAQVIRKARAFFGGGCGRCGGGYGGRPYGGGYGGRPYGGGYGGRPYGGGYGGRPYGGGGFGGGFASASAQASSSSFGGGYGFGK